MTNGAAVPPQPQQHGWFQRVLDAGTGVAAWLVILGTIGAGVGAYLDLRSDVSALNDKVKALSTPVDAKVAMCQKVNEQYVQSVSSVTGSFAEEKLFRHMEGLGCFRLKDGTKGLGN